MAQWSLGESVEILNGERWQTWSITRVRSDGTFDLWCRVSQARWHCIHPSRFRGSSTEKEKTTLKVGARVLKDDRKGRVVAVRSDGAVDVAWPDTVVIAMRPSALKASSDDEDDGQRVAVRYTSEQEYVGRVVKRHAPTQSVTVLARAAAPNVSVSHRFTRPAFADRKNPILVGESQQEALYDVCYDDDTREERVPHSRCRLLQHEHEEESMQARWCATRRKKRSSPAPRSSVKKGCAVRALVEGHWQPGVLSKQQQLPEATHYLVAFDDGRVARRVESRDIREFDPRLLDEQVEVEQFSELRVGAVVLAPTKGGSGIAKARVTRCRVDGTVDIVFDGDRRVHQAVDPRLLSQEAGTLERKTGRRGDHQSVDPRLLSHEEAVPLERNKTGRWSEEGPRLLSREAAGTSEDVTERAKRSSEAAVTSEVTDKARRLLRSMVSGSVEAFFAPVCEQGRHGWLLPARELSRLCAGAGLALSREELRALLAAIGASSKIPLEALEDFLEEEEEAGDDEEAADALRGELLRCAQRDGKAPSAKALFREIAQNKSHLTRADFAALLESLGAEDCSLLFARVDRDGDGLIGVDDFVAFVRLDAQQSAPRLLARELQGSSLLDQTVRGGWGELFTPAILRDIDLDGDGRVEVGEVRAFAGRAGATAGETRAAISSLRRGLGRWLASPLAREQLDSSCGGDLGLGLKKHEARILNSCLEASQCTLLEIAKETLQWTTSTLKKKQWQHSDPRFLLEVVDTEKNTSLRATEPIHKRLSWLYETKTQRVRKPEERLEPGARVILAGAPGVVLHRRPNGRYDVRSQNNTIARGLKREQLQRDPNYQDDEEQAKPITVTQPGGPRSSCSFGNNRQHGAESAIIPARKPVRGCYAAGSTLVIQ